MWVGVGECDLFLAGFEWVWMSVTFSCWVGWMWVSSVGGCDFLLAGYGWVWVGVCKCG